MIDGGWQGDLRRLTMKSWREESDVAAVVMVRHGDAAGWMNLKHVHLEEERLVWLWIRHAAAFRPPADILYADDLARIVAGEDQQQTEA